MTGNSVILGEGEPILRAALSQVLEGSGLAVVASCATGDELVAAITRTPADLVLADGELLEERPGTWVVLRSAHTRRRLLVLTSRPDVDRVQSLLREGAAGVVSRAADAATLVQACHTVIGGRPTIPAELASDLALRLVSGDRPLWMELTPRELEVMRVAAEGKTAAEIGRELFVSTPTAKTHLRRAYAKLGARNRSAAVAQLVRVGAPL